MRLDVARLDATGKRRGSIVLLHGAWCWNWYWKPFFMPYLAAQGYEVVAFSLRGHGASEGAALINSFSIGDYVRDLRAVVAGLDDPLIVGHSMGGFITQAYLTRYPARGAVLLAAAAPRPVFTQLFKIMLTQPFNVIRAGMNRTVPSGTSDLDRLRMQMFSRGRDDISMDEYLGNIQAESYRAIASMLTRGIRRPAAIATKLLVIGAGRDRLVPPEAVALTAKVYKTTPVMFDEMSHMLMLEPRWRDVADEIIRFAQTLPG
ncbi:MAG: alpha/beta fold hydrolase [Acidocella sp.]|nr:alpha/beta fold hydrolase [Acidocella sp.]